MIVVSVILIIQSYWDLRYKEIPIFVTACGAVVGVFYSIIMRRDIFEVLLAVLFGVILLGIGKITREAIGYGDGLLIGMMGFYYSMKEVLEVCAFAFVLAGFVSLILIVFFRKKGSYQLPFVPFILISNLVNLGSVLGTLG